MRQAIDRWTVAASAVLVLGVLLACKKKDEPAPAASAPVAPPAVSIAPLPTTTAAATAAAVAVDAGVVATPVLGDVKRFPDKEKPATGAVKVTVDNAPVFDEPDDKAQSVAPPKTTTTTPAATTAPPAATTAKPKPQMMSAPKH